MEVAPRAMMRSRWRLVSTVNVVMDEGLRLGPGGNPPAKVRRRTPMDLALVQGLLWLEKHPERENILNRIPISFVCRQGLLEGSNSPRI